MGLARRLGYLLLFAVVGVLMPFSIMVAGAAAFGAKGRLSRADARGVCRVDDECPSGFVCLNGRCVPAG